MNVAENLASAYLRLNGFLLLSHFTVFTGGGHNHVDLIGLRAPNSQERVNGTQLALDEALFNALSALRGDNSKSALVAIAAEVRTNAQRDVPTLEHVDYVRAFFGGVPVVTRFSFYDMAKTIVLTADGLDIGLSHTGHWIQWRIDSMHGQRLTKEGSWNLSDPFLADLLALRELGLLRT
jgi:hypothetical protein